MELPANAFKSELAAKQAPLYGCWLGLANAYTAEIVATAGFDWLLIDGEHAPNTVVTILEQLRATENYPAASIVRAVNHDPALIKQLLDIGAQTLMVPMVETGAQAEALVAAMRYAPAGIRGMGAGVIRADRWGSVADYATRAAESLCLITQVESKTGVDNARAIANTDGVDAVFVGPSDLSTNMGHVGDPGHADVQAAISRVLEVTKAAGKAAGILAPAEADTNRYREAGFDFIATGLDVALLKTAAEANAARHRGGTTSAERGTY
ncbi:HpcH/HpaI aldolase/citrate lyase family protein [Salinisphaera sp.]|uniref:HpcH/HpaI aldolase family protein n=1 Tax=Salinisphaera sp. TaxID=1914330 RepID=UPI002D770A2E|nr:HpcH/HpaI aldolase/citrate lyase family protein [Salinisphaera sp.]HET7314755.1 HpcH/HpaI aldolase/citrate lyase family protein [Salinisphaera sp.]